MRLLNLLTPFFIIRIVSLKKNMFINTRQINGAVAWPNGHSTYNTVNDKVLAHKHKNK